MDDNIIELKRGMDSKGMAFIVRGVSVTIEPPKDRALTINELAQVFDEAKIMAVKMHSISLANLPEPA